jgi:hypothetical protein
MIFHMLFMLNTSAAVLQFIYNGKNTAYINVLLFSAYSLYDIVLDIIFIK